MTVTSIVIAPEARADCQNAGGTTICSQGDIRASGGSGAGGTSGIVYPYPCEDDWLCSDGGIDLVFVDPSPPPDFGRPGRPGGGGGIGPR